MAELFEMPRPKGFLVRLWNSQASVRSLTRVSIRSSFG
jgi:hypothetical protein